MIYLIGNYKLLDTKSMFLYTRLIKKTLNQSKIFAKIFNAEPILNKKIIEKKFIFAKYLSYIDKYIIFGFKLLLKVKHNDIVHITDHANSLLIPFLRTKKIIITCHDLINIKKINSKNNDLSIWGKIYQKLILNNLKKAKIIICVSKNTQKELIKFGHINKSKTKVIYNVINQNFLEIDKLKNNNHNKLKYFIHVGDNKKYKNRIGVIRIFKELIKYQKFQKYHLILAGKKISEEISEQINKFKLNNKITNILNPTTKKLGNLYKHSDGLIFPSIEEGFGWPIIEAQNLGCIVYTTNKPPMNEIGNNSCIYIYPNSPKISARIILNSYYKRNKIKKNMKNNIIRFNFKNFKSKYINIIEHLKKSENSTCN